MLKLTGEKNKAVKTYEGKISRAKNVLSKMPNNDKLIRAAVYAEGNIFEIAGCDGLERGYEVLRSMRMFKENGSYQYQLNSRKTSKEANKEQVSKLFGLFGVSCKENSKSENNKDSEDR